MKKTVFHEQYPDSFQDPYDKTVFGFWVYLLTDFILFGTLFASYCVLRNNTFGGPSAKELFHLPLTLVQTLILLVGSFTAGLGGASAHRKNKQSTIAFFSFTALLGIAFMGMEGAEFFRLIHSGSSWQKSAFLSAYFTLVGTHGIHILFAILWTAILVIPVCRKGLNTVSLRRLICLKMFWQFLNVIWVFIFSLVYLLGVNSYD